MTESEKRQSVVRIMRGWIGRKESDGSHKAIIDIYNNHKPLAQNYKVKYTDSWCMTTASAAYIKAGLADIFPLECSCNRAIAKAKSMGCWVEADNYVPKPADAILYDWQDKGKGDDMGVPDHVGIVEKVEGSTIIVIEGNKSDAVQNRTVAVNQKFIRGYICPKFSADSAPAPQPAKQESKPAASVPSHVLRKGDKGAEVGTLQTMLNACGYYCGRVDNDFGSNTENATIEFQKSAFPNDPSEWDGKYGTKTKAKLLARYNSRSRSVTAHVHTSGSTLRLRNSSGVQIGSLANGAKVTVLSRKCKNMRISDATTTMSKISCNGAVGYVAERYLKY